MKHDKHYVSHSKNSIEVFKHKIVKSEGYVFNSEEEVDEEIFKICITEVHGVPDRSKNIDFSMCGSAIQILSFDDVLKELREKHHKE